MYPTLLLPVAAPSDAQNPVRLERFEIQGYQALGSGLLASIYRVLENWAFKTAVPGKLVSAVHLGNGDVGTPPHWISGQKLTDDFFGSVQYPKLFTLGGLKETVAKGVTRGTFGYVMGAQEVDGKLLLDGPDSLTMAEEVDADDIDLTEGSFIVSKAQANAFLAEFEGNKKTPDPDDKTDPDKDPDKELEEEPNKDPEEKEETEEEKAKKDRKARYLSLNFRAKGGQLFSAFTALQVLSEMANEEFTAVVRIQARSSKPIDRNLYEMSVLMPLDEEDIEVFE